MSKVRIQSIEDFIERKGTELGVSNWFEVSQDVINQFADATRDHQWIHVDADKAKTDSPYGSTIAHGYLTLSLLPSFLDEIIEVRNLKQLVNYGIKDFTFKNAVKAGSRLCMRGSDELIVGESRNAYMCGVDCETGELVTNEYTEDGKELECHPVSGLKFKGFKFPKWDELIKMLHEMAIQLKPTINYVGWDAVLTPKGLVIVEGNYYGQTLWQVVYKRGMAKEFEDLIGWHMEEGKPWWKYKINLIEKSAGLHDFD